MGSRTGTRSTSLRPFTRGGSAAERDQDGDLDRVQAPAGVLGEVPDQALHESLEESSDAWSMALQIHESADSIRRVRMFLLTDGVRGDRVCGARGGRRRRATSVDLGRARMHRLESAGERGEPIEIDFMARFGSPLACLPVSVPDVTITARISRPSRASGSRRSTTSSARGCLEKNVRSFLQFTGKVNRGMRDTIAGEDAPAVLRLQQRDLAPPRRGRVVDVADGGRHRAADGSADRQWRADHGVNTPLGAQRRRHRFDHRPGEDHRDRGRRLDGIVPLISQYAN